MTDIEHDIEVIARICHEANRVLQQALDEPAPSPPWDQAPHWQRSSSLEGVRRALAGAGPQELHESWCATKRAAGWVHGPRKDPDAKTHPCLVPWQELPASQRAKDELFAALVEAAAELPLSPPGGEGTSEPELADPQQPGAVTGYRPHPQERIDLVNEIKAAENELGRLLARLRERDDVDSRMLALGRTNLQQGFMWTVRAVFQPDSDL